MKVGFRAMNYSDWPPGKMAFPSRFYMVFFVIDRY